MATDRTLVLSWAEDAQFKTLPDDCVASGVAEEPNCHDRLEIFFSTQREIITQIGYTLTSTACPTVFACVNVLCGLAKGKSVLEAYLINSADIAKLLSDDGTLDKEHVHCAMMAELALKRAILNYSSVKKAQLASLT